MRILHIRNIVNVANLLATKQRDLGHEALTLGVLNKTMASKSEFNIDLEIEYSYRDVPNRLFRIVKSLIKHRDFDVFHLHDGGLLPRDIDVPLWFRMMGKVCVHWHGSKLRDSGAPGLSRYADEVFVSTPDLLKFVERGEWIPNPIDLQALPSPAENHLQKDDSIKIIHAPTRRAVKGTDGIISSVNRLKREGYNVELQLIENKTHEEVISTMQNSDIIIDQIIPAIGAYGLVSIEGMALGKPVICSLKEEYLKDFYGDCPIITANFNSLDERIRYLSEDESARRVLGKNGRVYVERMHEATTVTKKVLAFYN